MEIQQEGTTMPTLLEAIAHLEAISGLDHLASDTRIADLGVDSMDLLQWLFELEETLGVELDDLLGDDTEMEAFGDLTLAEIYDTLPPLISDDRS